MEGWQAGRVKAIYKALSLEGYWKDTFLMFPALALAMFVSNADMEGAFVYKADSSHVWANSGWRLTTGNQAYVNEFFIYK